MLAALSRPSIAALLILTLLAPPAIVAATHGPVGADAWWIAAVGRELLETGAVLRTNHFAYTDPTLPWVCHEWLLGLLFSGGLRAFGATFLVVLGVVCGGLTSVLALAAIGREVRTSIAAVVGALITLAPVAADLHGVRPLLLVLWMPVAMILLAFARARAALVVAVLLEWVWASSHGSFPLGIAIVVVAAIDDDDRARRRDRLLAAIAALTITFANPYGARLHGLVARYLLGSDEVSRYIVRNVAEFAPITRGAAPWVDGASIAGALAVSALAVSALVRRRRRARALFVLAIVALALHEVRHLLIAPVVGGVLLAGEVDDLVGDAPPLRARALIVPAIAAHVLAVVLAVVTFRSRDAAALIPTAHGGPTLVPLISSLPDGARVYAGFHQASYVIYWASPRGVRVFFDPRNDCYSARTWQAAIDVVSFGDGRATDILRAAGTTHALVPKTAAPYATDPRWSLVAAADEFALYRLLD